MGNATVVEGSAAILVVERPLIANLQPNEEVVAKLEVQDEVHNIRDWPARPISVDPPARGLLRCTFWAVDLDNQNIEGRECGQVVISHECLERYKQTAFQVWLSLAPSSQKPVSKLSPSEVTSAFNSSFEHAKDVTASKVCINVALMAPSLISAHEEELLTYQRMVLERPVMHLLSHSSDIIKEYYEAYTKVNHEAHCSTRDFTSKEKIYQSCVASARTQHVQMVQRAKINNKLIANRWHHLLMHTTGKIAFAQWRELLASREQAKLADRNFERLSYISAKLNDVLGGVRKASSSEMAVPFHLWRQQARRAKAVNAWTTRLCSSKHQMLETVFNHWRLALSKSIIQQMERALLDNVFDGVRHSASDASDSVLPLATVSFRLWRQQAKRARAVDEYMMRLCNDRNRSQLLETMFSHWRLASSMAIIEQMQQENIVKVAVSFQVSHAAFTWSSSELLADIDAAVKRVLLSTMYANLTRRLTSATTQDPGNHWQSQPIEAQHIRISAVGSNQVHCSIALPRGWSVSCVRTSLGTADALADALTRKLESLPCVQQRMCNGGLTVKNVSIVTVREHQAQALANATEKALQKSWNQQNLLAQIGLLHAWRDLVVRTRNRVHAIVQKRITRHDNANNAEKILVMLGTSSSSSLLHVFLRCWKELAVAAHLAKETRLVMLGSELLHDKLLDRALKKWGNHDDSVILHIVIQHWSESLADQRGNETKQIQVEAPHCTQELHDRWIHSVLQQLEGKSRLFLTFFQFNIWRESVQGARYSAKVSSVTAEADRWRELHKLDTGKLLGQLNFSVNASFFFMIFSGWRICCRQLKVGKEANNRSLHVQNVEKAVAAWDHQYQTLAVQMLLHAWLRSIMKERCARQETHALARHQAVKDIHSGNMKFIFGKLAEAKNSKLLLQFFFEAWHDLTLEALPPSKLADLRAAAEQVTDRVRQHMESMQHAADVAACHTQVVESIRHEPPRLSLQQMREAHSAEGAYSMMDSTRTLLNLHSSSASSSPSRTRSPPLFRELSAQRALDRTTIVAPPPEQQRVLSPFRVKQQMVFPPSPVPRANFRTITPPRRHSAQLGFREATARMHSAGPLYTAEAVFVGGAAPASPMAQSGRESRPGPARQVQRGVTVPGPVRQYSDSSGRMSTAQGRVSSAQGSLAAPSGMFPASNSFVTPQRNSYGN